MWFACHVSCPHASIPAREWLLVWLITSRKWNRYYLSKFILPTVYSGNYFSQSLFAQHGWQHRDHWFTRMISLTNRSRWCRRRTRTPCTPASRRCATCAATPRAPPPSPRLRVQGSVSDDQVWVWKPYLCPRSQRLDCTLVSESTSMIGDGFFN